MNYLGIPLPHDRENAEWNLELGNDFWTHADSRVGAYTPRCRCTDDGDSSNCLLWPHRRADDWCLAARSDRKRCSQPVTSGAPFCHFHMKRAWAAMFVAAGAEEQRKFERRLTEMRKRAGLEASIALAQEVDLTNLACRVYFFLADGAVKIGKSVRPEVRVKNFGSTKTPPGVDPRNGRLLGTIPGDIATERALHDLFGRHRLVGEWFKYKRVAARIEILLDGPEARRAA